MTTLEYRRLYVETFYEPRRSRVRVRPLPGQWAPPSVVVECSRSMRKAHPVGTVFCLEVAWKGYVDPDNHLYAHVDAEFEVVERADAQARIRRER